MQVLTARNRAVRVIQFVDDKVRHTGLGLWQCEGANDIRSHLNTIPMLHGDAQYAYNLPVSIIENDGTMAETLIPTKDTDTNTQKEGNVLTLLYAERETNKVTVGGEEREFVLTFVKKNALSLASDKKSANITVTVLEDDNKSNFTSSTKGVSFFRLLDSSKKGNYNLKKWGVAEAIGLKKRFELTGNYQSLHRSGRPRKYNKDDVVKISEIVKKNPSTTLKEIRQLVNFRVGITTIHRILRDILNFTYKKSTLRSRTKPGRCSTTA